MSIRTLFEMNHDYGHRIDEAPGKFAAALSYYLRGGSLEAADELERYGVVVFGARHHADAFSAEAIAKLRRREGSDRSAARDRSAAAIACVREVACDLYGNALTDDEIRDIARKIERAIKRATNRTKDEEPE